MTNAIFFGLWQEMEEIRSNHMREVASLTEACRRAESARREAVGRLEPVRSREEDMTGVLPCVSVYVKCSSTRVRFVDGVDTMCKLPCVWSINSIYMLPNFSPPPSAPTLTRGSLLLRALKKFLICH